MESVKRWYIGTYGGEAQARPCSPAELDIIHAHEGQLFVKVEDFDRVSAENLALQQRLTVQDQRADELEESLGRLAKELRGMSEHIRAFDEYGDFEHELNALAGLLEKSKRCIK